MAPTLTFWFDFSCPFAYLASTQVEGVAAEAGAHLDARPFLLGGVFAALGAAQNLAATLSAPKAAHNLADMHRHAALFGVPFAMPAGHPFRTVTALRCLLVVREQGADLLPLMHALYRAYWVDGVDLGDPAALRAVLGAVPAPDRADLHPDVLLARTQAPAIKDALRAATDQALAAGVFGAPALVVGDELFWGQDRLDAVSRALGHSPPSPPPPGSGPPVDVWFDYSSPFAYLGVSRARAFLGDAVRWRPMLLGAVFKALGGPVVPLSTFNPAKRAWYEADMRRQAAEAGVPLVWPIRFPLRTVLALRATLFVLATPDLADRSDALIRRLFALCWAQDADPSDPALVAACCDEVGLPGARIVAACATVEVKHLLFEATDEAVAQGVFGAPTFVLDPGGPAPALFWGNDRLPLLGFARRGFHEPDAEDAP
mgnify:CR=1 FL=1